MPGRVCHRSMETIWRESERVLTLRGSVPAAGPCPAQLLGTPALTLSWATPAARSSPALRPGSELPQPPRPPGPGCADTKGLPHAVGRGPAALLSLPHPAVAPSLTWGSGQGPTGPPPAGRGSDPQRPPGVHAPTAPPSAHLCSVRPPSASPGCRQMRPSRVRARLLGAAAPVDANACGSLRRSRFFPVAFCSEDSPGEAAALSLTFPRLLGFWDPFVGREGLELMCTPCRGHQL